MECTHAKNSASRQLEEFGYPFPGWLWQIAKDLLHALYNGDKLLLFTLIRG